MFWFSLQILSETFLILRITERDMIKNVYWSSCEVRVIIVSFFLSSLTLSTWFLIILKYQISRKSVLWEPNCYIKTDGRMDGWADRQTKEGQADMTMLLVTFQNFASEPKNHWELYKHSKRRRDWRCTRLSAMFLKCNICLEFPRILLLRSPLFFYYKHLRDKWSSSI